jgi:hypothetical protein
MTMNNSFRSVEPVPLVIGVTGHRDLVPAEIPLIKQKVRDVLLDLRKRYSDLPISVISPLAQGADQLVAEVVIELQIPLCIVTPMPVAQYRRDFEGEALATLEEYLELGELIELPLLASQAQVQGEQKFRDQQYVELGGYVAAHSHILLALWDGCDSGPEGGTASVVRFHQHDTMAPLSEGRQLSPIDFAEDESDLVHHIACSRLSSATEAGLRPGDVHWLTRDELTPRTKEMPERYTTVFNRMAEFNRDAANIIVDTTYGLIPPEELEASSPGVQEIAWQFHVADSLAGRFQRSMMNSLTLGYALIVLAGICFIVYADLYSEKAMIFGYLAIVSSVLVVFALENRFGWQRRYPDYRVLAEALRVQFYWSLAGVTMNGAHKYSHDSFHENRDLELGWIRNVMRYTARHADADLHLSNTADYDNVVRHWVGNDGAGQRQYYLDKSTERAKRNRLTRILEAGGFGLVIVAIMALIFLPEENGVSNYLIALVGLLPFLVAVRQNYAHRTGEKELMSQYSYYYSIFSSAHNLLKKAESLSMKREILRALGEAALDESSQWIMRQRERPGGTGSILGG